MLAYALRYDHIKKAKSSPGLVSFNQNKTKPKKKSLAYSYTVLPKSNLTAEVTAYKLCSMYQKLRTVLQVTQQRGFVKKTAKCSF